MRLTEKTKGSRAKQKLPALLDYKSKANIFLRNGQLLLTLRAEEQMTDNLVFEGPVKGNNDGLPPKS